MDVFKVIQHISKTLTFIKFFSLFILFIVLPLQRQINIDKNKVDCGAKECQSFIEKFYQHLKKIDPFLTEFDSKDKPTFSQEKKIYFFLVIFFLPFLASLFIDFFSCFLHGSESNVSLFRFFPLLLLLMCFL